jgi:hypothetical protein
VVDAVEPPLVGGQQMAALAVGVVDDRVEDGQPPQPLVVGVHQQGRLPLADLREADRLPAGPGSGSEQAVDQGEQFGLESPGPSSAAVSIHSWHMPSPYGPSRSTVVGTRPQPVASETS